MMEEQHYRVLCWSRCHVSRVSTWSRLITVSRVTMWPGRVSDSYCLLLAAAPAPAAPPRPRDTAAACSGETADIGHGAICSLSPLSLRFRDLDKLTWLAAKIPHSTLFEARLLIVHRTCLNHFGCAGSAVEQVDYTHSIQVCRANEFVANRSSSLCCVGSCQVSCSFSLWTGKYLDVQSAAAVLMERRWRLQQAHGTGRSWET